MVKTSEIAKDLYHLGTLFQQKGNSFIQNPHIITNLITNHKAACCAYTLGQSNPLIFTNVQIGRNHIPADLKPHNTRVKLWLNFECRNTTDEHVDSIQSLGVNVKIIANLGLDKGKFFQSWHLDKTNPNATEEEVEFTHPTYHFNFGGNIMRKSEEDFGALMLISSPRICHPPLDIVLAIDFVMRNFYTKKSHSKITEQKIYKKCVKNAADRFWRPYAVSYASFWPNAYSKPAVILPKEIYPSLNCTN